MTILGRPAYAFAGQDGCREEFRSRQFLPLVPQVRTAYCSGISALFSELLKSADFPFLPLGRWAQSRAAVDANQVHRRCVSVRPQGARSLPPAGCVHCGRIGTAWLYAFRRGLASTLFAVGAEDLVVQRVLRHSKVIVTREHHIRRFDHTSAGCDEDA